MLSRVSAWTSSVFGASFSPRSGASESGEDGADPNADVDDQNAAEEDLEETAFVDDSILEQHRRQQPEDPGREEQKADE